MRVLFVSANFEGEVPARHLVERHMLGWAVAALASNVTYLDVAVYMTTSGRVSSSFARGISFFFQEPFMANHYRLSPVLTELIEKVDLVHIFSPFTPVGETALILSEAFRKPVVVTDYGLRTSSTSVRNDARNVVRNVVRPAELRMSALDSLQGKPGTSTIVLPSFPMSKKPTASVMYKRPRVLLLRPNLRRPEVLRQAQEALAGHDLFVLRELNTAQDMKALGHLWPGIPIRPVLFTSTAAALAFYETVSAVWDFGGEILGDHAFDSDVQVFAAVEAAVAGVSIERSLVSADPHETIAPAQYEKSVGDEIARFYCNVVRVVS